MLLREILRCYQQDLGYSVDDLAQLLAADREDLLVWYQIATEQQATMKGLRIVKERFSP